MVDTEDFAVERLAQGSLDAAVREGFVRRQLGAVVEHDELRRSELMRTLAVWLDTGCNTAHAARNCTWNGSRCTTGSSGFSSCAAGTPGNGQARRASRGNTLGAALGNA